MSGLQAALVVLLLTALPVYARAQTAIPTCGASPSGSGTLDDLVVRHLAAVDEYRRTFRNLSALETKTIELISASGTPEKRREIVSDFVVYRSSRDETATEYRDVRSVDGKAIENRGERALKLLTNAARAESVKKELEAIDRETRRYEFRRHLRGATASQGGIPKQWRETVHVELAGGERIAERDVLVLVYRQTSGPGSSLPLPKEFGNANLRSQGRLWIDRETCQLWRAVWELAASHPAASEPLVMIHAESTYAPSSFGILVPERIVFEWRQRFSHVKNDVPSFGVSERTTFTYASFKRFGVATDEQLRVLEEQPR